MVWCIGLLDVDIESVVVVLVDVPPICEPPVCEPPMVEPLVPPICEPPVCEPLMVEPLVPPVVEPLVTCAVEAAATVSAVASIKVLVKVMKDPS